MRSRCLGSMFAWILKMNPVNLDSSGATSRLDVSRGLGLGAMSMKVSSISCTPKLFTALPKKTGASLPSRYGAWSQAS